MNTNVHLPDRAGRGGRSTGFYFLTSARLGFREWNGKDLPFALKLWGDPNVTRLIDARGHLTEEQVKDRLAQEISTMQAHGVQYWPLFLLTDNEFVGCCGLRPYKPSEAIFEMGVHLCTSHWGKGYATEAGRTVMKHAFSALRANGLFAGHHPMNIASQSLLRKLGFCFTHNEHYEPTGLKHPSYLITAEEFVRMES